MAEAAPHRGAEGVATTHSDDEPATPLAVPRLVIRNLHAGYGVAEILHGVDLELAAGESLCLVGPNGAGKSTVLNAVFGLCDLRSGQVLVQGVDAVAFSAAQRLADLGVAYVLQHSSVFPDLSVESNLALGAYVLRSAAKTRDAVAAILQQYPRLAERRRERAGVLSGGERRQLEIARALITQPRLLLIDEPSIGLDPKGVEAVFAMLRGVQQRLGTAILLVEQNVRQGLAFADRGMVLVAGKPVAQGNAAELLSNPLISRLFLGD